MSVLAVVRPDSWDLPLFIHILGSMVLVGALALSAVALFAAWRSGSPAMTRLGFMAVFYGALPGWIVMRGGAQWIANKEGLDGDNVDLSWVDMGFSIGDTSFVLLIALLVMGGIAVRRIARDGSTSLISTRIAAGLVSFLIVAYLVAVWAMTTKPV